MVSSAGSDDGLGKEGVPNNMNDDKNDAPMSISSDEVNFMILRYLQEAGFVHSAFAFAHESMLGRTNLRSMDKSVPPGALITFLRKGLQYVGIEEGLREDGEKADEEFTLLSSAAMNAISRKNPPIQLNVPPAAAAAAVKAKLEAEAKIQAERNVLLSSHINQHAIQNGAFNVQQLIASAPSGVLEGPHASFARQALAAQAAAAMSQMQQFQQAGGQAPQHPSAAELIAHHQRAADLMALQQQQVAVAAVAQRQTSAPPPPPPPPPPPLPPECESAAGEPGGKRAAAASAKRGVKKTKKSKEAVMVGGKPLTGFASLGEAAMQRLGGTQSGLHSNDQNGLAPHAMDVDEHEDTDARPTTPQHRMNGVNGPGLHGVLHDKAMNGIRARKSAGIATGGEVLEVEADPDDRATNASSQEILKLEMHQSEVFMCAWNPVFTDLIATGSGDASARIWQMGGLRASAGLTTVKLLPHGTDPRDRKNKDVTTLEWSSDGTLLATGSYDGVARVWARNGALIHTLRGHNGPIFSLKWNTQGNYLLSGSYDKTTIVWDVSGSTGFVEQQFTDHEAPALDVDWKDNNTFASCSTDKTVHICRVGVSRPLKVFSGHADEVNAVKWDPSGRYLASCSDDCTAKVWDIESDRTDPLYDLKSHQQEIYTVKWSPTGPGSRNPSKMAMLATASFDGSVRLWNILDGSCYRIFNRHKDSVYSVAFAPSGDFLASGSLAGQMYVWNIQEGRHVKSFKGKGDIFEVAWNKEETRIAACFSSNVVAIIDFDRANSI